MLLLLAIAVAIAAGRKQAVSGMDDPEVSLENIRRGVANGWYSAVLTHVDGMPAVRLSGRLQDGSEYADVYPISEADYQQLLTDGTPEE